MNWRRNLLIDAAGRHKNIRQVDDPAMQKLYQEQADRMLLASFTSGILGNPDRQVRYTFPFSMNEAFRRAIAYMQERRNEAFILHSESRKHNSADRPNPGERGRDQSKCSTQHIRARPTPKQSNRISPGREMERNKSACNERRGVWHYAKEYPTRKRRRTSFRKRCDGDSYRHIRSIPETSPVCLKCCKDTLVQLSLRHPYVNTPAWPRYPSTGRLFSSEHGTSL
jgi:hypothetical protein